MARSQTIKNVFFCQLGLFFQANIVWRRVFVLSCTSCRSSRGGARKCHKVKQRPCAAVTLEINLFQAAHTRLKENKKIKSQRCVLHLFFVLLLSIYFHPIRPYLTLYWPQPTAGSQSADVSPRLTFHAVSCCSISLTLCAAGPNK